MKQKEQELREKKFGSKINKTFTFDFAGLWILLYYWSQNIYN